MNPIGAKGQTAYAIEKTPGGEHGSFKGAFVSSTSLGSKVVEEASGNMHPRGVTTEGDIVRRDIGGDHGQQPSVDAILDHLILEWGHGIHTALGGGAHQWLVRELLDGDTPLDPLPQSIAWEIDKNETGYAELLKGLRPTKSELKLAANKRAAWKVDYLGAYDTSCGDAVADAGNTGNWTGQLLIKGHALDETGDDLQMKVTSAAPLKVKFTHGANPYGGAGTEIAVTLDSWADIIDETSAIEGANDYEPLQFMMTTGTGAPAVDDVFDIPVTRTKKTVTFPATRPLICTGAYITADGVRKHVKEATITHTFGKEVDFGLGAVYGADEVLTTGDRALQIALNRRYVDRDFVRWLKAAESIAFTATLLDRFIGASGFREKINYSVSKLRVGQAGVQGIPTKEALTEAPVLTAVLDESTNGSLAEITVICGVSAWG
jgi:hypothetical protein